MPSHHTASPRNATRSNVAGRAARSRASLLYGGGAAPPNVTWVALTSIGWSLCHAPSIEGDAAAAQRCGLGNGAGANPSDSTAKASVTATRRMAGLQRRGVRQLDFPAEWALLR